MQKSKFYLLVAVLGIATTTAIVSVSANAQNRGVDNSFEPGQSRGAMFNSEQHQAEIAALEAGDYEAWQEALADHPRAEEFATEERFNNLVEIHKLMSEGKFEEAQTLRQDLGLKGCGAGEGANNGKMFGPRHGVDEVTE